MSDEESEAKGRNNAAIVEFLISMVQPIQKILSEDSDQPITTSFSDGRVLALGNTKVRAVELLQSIISLKNPEIIKAVCDSEIMNVILGLIEKHPWNNIITLKTNLIFEDVLSCDIESVNKFEFLKVSDVTNILVRMSKTPELKLQSGNIIRNGYMGFVIKLANLIVKHKAQNEMEKIEGQADVFNASWKSFVTGELEASNERNQRNLGGRPTSTTSEDDETSQFDVNMDNIMKRFKCFNTLVQNNSSTDDDDKDDKEDKD